MFKKARIRIRIQGLLNPDWYFWLDPDSIEYGSKTLESKLNKNNNFLVTFPTVHTSCPTWGPPRWRWRWGYGSRGPSPGPSCRRRAPPIQGTHSWMNKDKPGGKIQSKYSLCETCGSDSINVDFFKIPNSYPDPNF